MSKASRITILCEDLVHEVLVKSFLKTGWNIGPHVLRPVRCGSKNRLDERFPEEVRALRSRSASTILLVVRDADQEETDNIKKRLDGMIAPNTRSQQANIVYFLPKWHIETWLAYLDGETVDENEKQRYKDNYHAIAESKEGHRFADDIAYKCSQRTALPSLPPSFADACVEFERIRDALK